MGDVAGSSSGFQATMLSWRHTPAATAGRAHCCRAPVVRFVPYAQYPGLKWSSGRDVPCSLQNCHRGALAVPRLVRMTITPFAASEPYSVAADGPLTTSMDSISYVLKSARRPGRNCLKVPLTAVVPRG